MSDTGISEQTETNALATFWAGVSLAASVVAITFGGGVAIVAGAIAAVCLIESIAASFTRSETPFERYCRECDQMPVIQASQEIVVSQARQNELSHDEPSHHWRQTVAAKVPSGRSH